MIKPIPEFPDYFASDSGEIYSLKPRGARHAKPKLHRYLRKRINTVNKKQYFVVNLFVDKRMTTHKVSKLVLLAFVGNRPERYHACHGIKGSLVDSLDNLYWAAPKQNMADKHRDGTYLCGDKCGGAKLTADNVKEIRRMYSYYGRGGTKTREIQKLFNVSQPTIHNIVKHKTWRWLS